MMRQKSSNSSSVSGTTNAFFIRLFSVRGREGQPSCPRTFAHHPRDQRVASAQPGNARRDPHDETEHGHSPAASGDDVALLLSRAFSGKALDALPDRPDGGPEEEQAQGRSQQFGLGGEQREEPGAE